MINPNDSIRFTNVVSKKYQFYYTDMDKAIKEFLNDIDRKGAIIKGPLFYSLNNVPMDKNMNVELFMPIKQDKFKIDKDMYFHSYFSIEDMVSIYVHANFEKNTEIAYAALLNYMDENKLNQVTPIFHILSGDETMQYVAVKVGVISDEENENDEKESPTDIENLRYKGTDKVTVINDNLRVFR